jgi:hypothetical protein
MLPSIQMPCCAFRTKMSILLALSNHPEAD